MKLVIAARKSDLARLQAYQVGKALEKAHSHLKIQYQFSLSLGDKNLGDPLWKMPEKGVFTEDLKQELLSGSVDLAVHSWKDLPIDINLDTEIIGTLDRADMRDLLLVKRSSVGELENTKSLKLLSSSPRRIHHLAESLPKLLPIGNVQLEFSDIRGNINTRLQKLLSGNADGLVVAKAAIDRLLSTTEDEFKEARHICMQALEQCEFIALPLSLFPSAPAQGALAIEVLRSRKDLKELVNTISNIADFKCVEEERQGLAKHGGGCHQKIGISVLQRPFGKISTCRGLTEKGEILEERRLQKEPEKKHSTNISSYFPKNKSEGLNYKRNKIEKLSDQIRSWPGGLFVARANALPEEVDAKDISRTPICCAGLQTWQKLAARGHWVNACTESLGESEDFRLETLLGGQTEWLKLTHSHGDQGPFQQKLATYNLELVGNIPDMRACSHFYWMSYWAFQQAVEKYPEILQAQHACGPGNSFEKIKKHLSGADTLTVFLTYDDWKTEMLGMS